jgi:hypothetical protein
MRENYDCLLKDLDAELLYNFRVINVSKGCVTRAPKGCRYVRLKLYVVWNQSHLSYSAELLDSQLGVRT